MSNHSKTVISNHGSEHGTFLMYLWGFALSIILTITAYEFVTHHTFSYTPLVAVIIGLALVQFLVQIFFFLHLGKETKPRWKLAVLVFMIIVVLILVAGTLWIMNNLNYRMMEDPNAMYNYVNSQNGF